MTNPARLVLSARFAAGPLTRSSTSSIRRGQGGFVGGGEGIVFGLLILVAGSLAVLNTWSIVDTRAAVDAAAREYLRSYSEASSPHDAAGAGRRAAVEVITGRGLDPSSVEITAPDLLRFGPCQPATVTIEATAPAARLPFIDDFGSHQIRVTHTELVDAHREMTVGPNHDQASTPCSLD